MEEQTSQKPTNPASWIILIIVVVVVLVGGYFLFFQEEETTFNTRTIVNTNTAVNENTNTVANTNTEIDTSDWQIDTSEKDGYRIKYPREGTYRELSSGIEDRDDMGYMVDFTLGDLGIRISADQNSVNAVALNDLIDANLKGGVVDEYEQMSIKGMEMWKKYTFLPTDTGSQRMGAGITVIGERYYYVFTTGNQFTPEFTLEREKLYNTFISTFEFVNQVSHDTSDWLTYENDILGFSLQYPADWTLVETSPSEDSSGQVIYIQSPETAVMLQNGTIHPGYAKNVVVSFWSSINNQQARGGSWIGQREYDSLTDYFTDENAPKKKIGEVTVDGLPAYEVSIGGYGLAYGVMVENNGIYEIAFLTAWDKLQLGTIEQEILSTFVLTK